jgi:hypothetical protein
MALIKTIAGYWKDPEKRDEWVPQQVVEMDPMEEAQILADWARAENMALKPEPMTTSQELDLLLSDGADAVKAARAQHLNDMATWQATQQPLEDAFQKATGAYEASMNNLEADNPQTI